MQTLFDQNFDAEINLLPKDGTVNYYGKILDQKQSDRFYLTLLAVSYTHLDVYKRQPTYFLSSAAEISLFLKSGYSNSRP